MSRRVQKAREREWLARGFTTERRIGHKASGEPFCDEQPDGWSRFIMFGGSPLMEKIYPGSVQYTNTKYRVWVRFVKDEDATEDAPTAICHLSIRTEENDARHDWREFQRIKNELVGPQYEAVEIYPAEERLVDTANQYHLFCFCDPEYRLPYGFRQAAKDGDGLDELRSMVAPKARQRETAEAPLMRPADESTLQRLFPIYKIYLTENCRETQERLEALRDAAGPDGSAPEWE